MELKCPECDRKYNIPEDKLDGKRVYFDCQCGHRIVIDSEPEPWNGFMVLDDGITRLGDIFKSYRLSFNLKSYITALFTLMGISFIFLIGYFIVRSNISFFAEYWGVTSLLGLIFLIALQFLYGIGKILISKNVYYNIDHGENISYGAELSSVFSSLKSRILLYLIPTTFLYFIMIPLFGFSQGGGVVYGAIIFPFVLPVTIILFFIVALSGFVDSFLAIKGRKFLYSVKSLWNFFIVENVNLFYYNFLSNFSTAVVAIPLLILTFIFLLIPYLAVNGVSLINQFSISSYGSDGNIFYAVVISTVLIFYIMGAYLFVLNQTYKSVATRIMTKSPNNSVGGGKLFIFAISMVIATVVVTAFKFII